MVLVSLFWAKLDCCIFQEFGWHHTSIMGCSFFFLNHVEVLGHYRYLFGGILSVNETLERFQGLEKCHHRPTLKKWWVVNEWTLDFWVNCPFKWPHSWKVVLLLRCICLMLWFVRHCQDDSVSQVLFVSCFTLFGKYCFSSWTFKTVACVRARCSVEEAAKVTGGVFFRRHLNTRLDILSSMLLTLMGHW